MTKRNIILKFDSKEIDFKLGLGFLGESFDELDVDLQELITKLNRNPFKLVPQLMFISAKYSAELKGAEFEETISDYIDMLDDAGGINCPQSAAFLKAFFNSINKDVPEEKSKKQTGPKKK